MISKIDPRVWKKWEERYGGNIVYKIVIDLLEIEYPFLNFGDDKLTIDEGKGEKRFLLWDEFMKVLSKILQKYIDDENEIERMIKEANTINPEIVRRLSVPQFPKTDPETGKKYWETRNIVVENPEDGDREQLEVKVITKTYSKTGKEDEKIEIFKMRNPKHFGKESLNDLPPYVREEVERLLYQR